MPSAVLARTGGTLKEPSTDRPPPLVWDCWDGRDGRDGWDGWDWLMADESTQDML